MMPCFNTSSALQAGWREVIYSQGRPWVYQLFDMTEPAPGAAPCPGCNDPFTAPLMCIVGRHYQAAIPLTPVALAILLEVTALPDGPTLAIDVDLTGPVPQSTTVLALGDGLRLPVADLLCGTGKVRDTATHHVERLARERAAAGQFPKSFTVDAYLANLRDLFGALDAHARGFLQ